MGNLVGMYSRMIAKPNSGLKAANLNCSPDGTEKSGLGVYLRIRITLLIPKGKFNCQAAHLCLFSL